MSLTQTIARNLLSDRLYESMRAESQSWVMRCPCGAETSIWEMGGIRWKAAGEPRRMGHCGTCQRSFWGQVYRQARRRAPGVSLGMLAQHEIGAVKDETLDQTILEHGKAGTLSTCPQADTCSSPADAFDSPGTTMTTPGPAIELSQTAAVLLWIDGVGCWMVFPGQQVTIGGPVEPGSSQAAADLCALANLRRLHATIERSGESYRLSSVDAGEPTFLRDGSEINLGGRLRLGFRVPSVLSQSAVLSPADEPWPRMFTAGRTPASVDGIVLMDEVCLMGAGSDAHVPCRDWDQTVILFRRGGQLWCRSQGEMEIDGQNSAGGRPLHHGAMISGSDWRIRVESVKRQEQSS
jgi:hypothetical protein